jgi:hypothetical protein
MAAAYTDANRRRRRRKKKMKQSKFPPGWNSEGVKRVLARYEPQSKEETVSEDEASFEALGQTVMEVPTELVPTIRKLIARHQAHDIIPKIAAYWDNKKMQPLVAELSWIKNVIVKVNAKTTWNGNFSSV